VPSSPELAGLNTPGSDNYDPFHDTSFTAQVTDAEVPTSVYQLTVAEAAFQEKLKRQDEQDNYSAWDIGADMWSTSSMGSASRIAIDAVTGESPVFQVNLTPLDDATFAEKLKAAQASGLSDEALSELADARNVEEFDYIVQRARQFAEANERLASQGFGTQAANFLWQSFNPVELALGYGYIGPAVKTAKGLNASRKAVAGISAAGSAAALTSSLAIQDAGGAAPSLGEYIFAAGLGASLGAALGPVGYSPASAAERKAIEAGARRVVTVGEKVSAAEVAATEAAANPPPAPKAAVVAAEQAARDGEPAPAPAPAPDAKALKLQLRNAKRVFEKDRARAEAAGEDVEALKSGPRAQKIAALEQQLADLEGAPKGAIHAPADSFADALNDVENPGALNSTRVRYSRKEPDEPLEDVARKSILGPARDLLQKTQHEYIDALQMGGHAMAAKFLKRRIESLEANIRALENAKTDGGFSIKPWPTDLPDALGNFQGNAAQGRYVYIMKGDLPVGHVWYAIRGKGKVFIKWFGLYGKSEQNFGRAHDLPPGAVKSFARGFKELHPDKVGDDGKVAYTGLRVSGAHSRIDGPAGAERQTVRLSRQDPMEASLARPGAIEAAREILSRILPDHGGVGVKIDDALPQGINGQYLDRLIHLATNADDLEKAAYHEGTHALKAIGVINTDDWTKLVDKAWSKQLQPLRDKVEKLYGPDELDYDQFSEELVAHMIAARAKGETFGAVDAILEKVISWLRTVRDTLGVSGYRTAQDVFDDIDTGALAKTFDENPQLWPDSPLAEKGSVGAAMTPDADLPADLEFVRDQAVRWIKNEDVPYTAYGGVRPDRAAFAGKSDNPISRLLGKNLLDDSVGLADHSENSFSADLDQEQLFGKLAVPYLQARDAQRLAYQNAMGVPRFKRHFAAKEFYENLGRFMSGEELPKNMPAPAKAAIKKLADVMAEQFELARRYAQNPKYRADHADDAQIIARPLINAVNLKPPEAGKYYFPRKYSAFAVQEAVKREDGKFLDRIFTEAIREAQPGLQPEYLERLGKGFAKNVKYRSFGLGDEWSIAFADGDRSRLMKFLMEDAEIPAPDAETIVTKMMDGRAPDPGAAMGNFKNRVLLNENYVDPITGFKLMDLMEKNADDAFQTYMMRLSGRLAMARMEVRAPTLPRFKRVYEADGKTFKDVPDGVHGGEIILDGVREDADLDRYFRSMKEWAAQFGDMRLQRQTDVDIQRFKFAYDRVMKRPLDVQQGTFAQVLRNLRDYNFIRLMWAVPISMMNEFVLPVATLGVKAGFKHMPAMRRVIDQAGKAKLNSVLFDEIEHMGIGHDTLHRPTFRAVDNYADDQLAAINGSFHQRLTDWLQYGTKLTSHYSGMAGTQAFSERLAASAAFQKLSLMAEKFRAGHKFDADDLQRWRQLGLSDGMMKRVLDNFRHAETEGSVYFPGSGKKLTRLRLDKWEPDVADAVEQAVFRLTRKLIQKQSVGNTAIWMSDPLYQSIFQFRNFSFSSLPNHTLYNLHMRDAAAVRTILWSTTWAATVRAMQLQLTASMRPDGDEYLEKYGSAWQLAKAGFSRSGYASVSPMFIDTLLRMLGQPGAFEARSTGQPSDIFGGSPLISAYNSAVEGVGGIAGSFIDSREMSQAELRALGSLLPGYTIPLTGVFSHLVADRPKKAPRKDPPF
jgi:hypothetical protein